MKLSNTIAIGLLVGTLTLAGCAGAWPSAPGIPGIPTLSRSISGGTAYAAALQRAATPAAADRAAAHSTAPGSVARHYWLARAAYDAAPLPPAIASPPTTSGAEANTPASIIRGIRHTVATVGGAAAPILGPATGGLYSAILAAILAALAAAGGITTTIERRRRKRAEAQIPAPTYIRPDFPAGPSDQPPSPQAK